MSDNVPTEQRVEVNANSLQSQLSVGLLNGVRSVKLKRLLIHEMLHGLGICGGVWELDGDWYTGKRAVQAYGEMTGTEFERIPVENHFGKGTSKSHWEEGAKPGRVYQHGVDRRDHEGRFHPALGNEIMSGFQGDDEYFTGVTAGALEDLGYTVNWDAKEIVNLPRRLIQKRTLLESAAYGPYNAAIFAFSMYIYPLLGWLLTGFQGAVSSVKGRTGLCKCKPGRGSSRNPPSPAKRDPFHGA